MIKNKLKFHEGEHNYYLKPLSVTRVVNQILNTQIPTEIRNKSFFIKAMLEGTQMHKWIERYILLKGSADPKTPADPGMVANFKRFYSSGRSSLNLACEYVVVNTISPKKKVHSFILAGTIDAVDIDNKTLLEWKTSSTNKSLKSWIWQCRIYAHLIQNKVKKILIYNVRIDEVVEIPLEPLAEDELELVYMACEELVKKQIPASVEQVVLNSQKF